VLCGNALWVPKDALSSKTQQRDISLAIFLLEYYALLLCLGGIIAWLGGGVHRRIPMVGQESLALLVS
jgi:hypothetical protein